MPFTMTMPKLSPTMEEGTIVKWHKKEGEYVNVGDVLMEVATDKATVEYVSMDEGYLRKIVLHEDSSAVINQPIAIFSEKKDESIEGYLLPPPPKKEEAPKEQVVAKAIPQTTTGPLQPKFEPLPPLENYEFAFPLDEDAEHVKASPLARRLAKESGVDINSIKGSGPSGRIVSADINKGLPLAPVSFGKRERPHTPPGSYHNIKPNPMRKTIAKRLQEAKTFIPHWYCKQKIRADAMMQIREQLRFWEQKVTYNDFVVRAVALALRKHPAINAGYNSADDTLIYYDTVDISIAVSIEGGLITPIIRHADFKNLGQLSCEIRYLANKARENQLQPHEYQGGSFTISNLGMYGITDFQAIINPPQAAILAVGGIEEQPFFVEDKLIKGHTLTLSLSADHRVIDGSIGAEFMGTLKQYLENPAGLLL